jgi:hypothetical protein
LDELLQALHSSLEVLGLFLELLLELELVLLLLLLLPSSRAVRGFLPAENITWLHVLFQEKLRTRAATSSITYLDIWSFCNPTSSFSAISYEFRKHLINRFKHSYQPKLEKGAL